MKAYFVSDIHLKAEDGPKGQLFVKFLKELPNDTTHLVLLGDIFDLWLADHNYFVQKFPNIIKEVQNLVSKKVEVHYFEGNHDLHLKKFWQEKLKVQVHHNHHIFNWPGITVRAEHGDLMNPDDTGYLFLRKFLRNPIMKVIAHNLPGKAVGFIGDRSSQMSRVYTDRLNQKYKETVQNLTRNYAQKIYAETPFDLFVSGHTHVDDDFSFELNGKKVRSLNLGSWLDKPKYLIVERDTIAIKHL